jgi:hypothetical protein
MSNAELYLLYKKSRLQSQKSKYVELIEKNTANKIEKIFRELFKNFYDDFVLVFEKTECRISGSFPLQCLLDEIWDNSDIDIYTFAMRKKAGWDNLIDDDDDDDDDDIDMDKNGDPIIMKKQKEKSKDNPNAQNIINFLEDKVGCKFENHLGGAYNNICVQKKGDHHTDIITDVIDTKIDDKMLQIISIKENNDIDKCIYDFDFDICKNICGIKNGKFFVKIYKIKDIFEKKFNFNYNGHLKTIQRTEKYIKRGFDVILDKEHIYKQLKSDLEKEHKDCTNNYPEYCRKAKRRISIHDTAIDLSDFYNKIYTMQYNYHAISSKKINLHSINDDIIKDMVLDSIINNYNGKIANIELCHNDCVLRLLDKTHFHYKSNVEGYALEHIFVQKEKQIKMIPLNISSEVKIQL